MNQRYNQSGRQLVEKSKVFTKYKNHVDNFIQDSQMSYNQIQTPGWTSLANTQQSKEINIDKNNQHLKNNESVQNNNKKVDNRYHNEILNRLNSLPKIDKQQKFYPKMRLFSSIDKNKNVIVYGSAKIDQNKKQQAPKSINSQKPFVNKFSSQKNKQFNSQRKQEKQLSERKRIYSVKQVQMNLKDRIKDRISLQSTKKLYTLSKFDQNNIITKKLNHPNQYSKPFTLKQIPQNNNQYLKNHLNKLHYKSQSLTNLQPSKKLKDPNKIHSSVKQRPSFNSITIHEHLYQNSIKLELKRNMTRMVQDSYNRINTLTFMPEISGKSSFIAQEKFKKQNCQLNPNHYHQNCDLIQRKLRLDKFSSITNINSKAQSKQKQNMKQVIQERTLLKLYNFLASKKQFLVQKDLQQNIQKLPLALIQTLDPLITTIFKVQKIDSKYFIQFFNSHKQLKSKINNIVSLIQKSLAQLMQTKENNFNQINIC